MRVLIAGTSTRAAAGSAVRAGFTVTALDAFGDIDQAPSVQALSLPRDFGEPFSASAAARAGRGLECGAVAYLSSFENHPRAVQTLAAGRPLWGNAPEVLQRVRQPAMVTRMLGRRGLPALDVRQHGLFGSNVLNVPNDPNDSSAWLVKPLRSGGGYRIRRWRAGRLPRGSYLQQFVEGTPGSVVFVAAGGRAVPLGLSRQLVGEHAFGADGFRYCGSILGPEGDPQFTYDDRLVTAACSLAHAVVEDFGLVGVNGIDFVARDGVPYTTEVNPRWSASMELVERAFGLSVFGVHAEACASGALPEFDYVRQRRRGGAVGKAVVFARGDVIAVDTRAWLADAGIRDVPHPGERIRAGQPICTVFAEGPDAAACHQALVRRAEQIYARVTSCERQAARRSAPGQRAGTR